MINLENEIWKDIKGYEGKYQISSIGRIKSLGRWVKHKGWRFEEERMLNQYMSQTGYFYVALSKDSIQKKYKVHRLVAEAFLENPDNLPVINHKNEVKTDNRVENLEFCSVKYNTNYGSGRAKMILKIKKPVVQLDLNDNVLKRWDSLKDITDVLGYNKACISECCHQKQQTAYGYKWKFAS